MRGADPKLSGLGDPEGTSARAPGAEAREAEGGPADPILSAPAADPASAAFSLDHDPSDRSPAQLGQVLGLDRAPEVKTLRRKLARLAAQGCSAELGHALARRRVATRGHALGFLYVDGHVRAYHGRREIPKAHVTRMRIAMPATAARFPGARNASSGDQPDILERG